MITITENNHGNLSKGTKIVRPLVYGRTIEQKKGKQMTYTVTNKRDNISNEYPSITSALAMVASCWDGAGIVCEVVNNETGEQVEIYRNPLTGWKVA